ncbi:MAG: carbohydrate kinase, partial [Lentisphaerae bacterium]|nr:carbohydrate kinase [Lentisphaerota bacterium]
MGLLLGIDLGTSYFKLCLFDTDLRLRGLGRQPVPVAGPPPRQEVAVDAFWRTLRRGLDEALAAAGASAGDIGA